MEGKKTFFTKKTIIGIIGIIVFLLIAYVLPCPAALAEAAVAKETTPEMAMIALGIMVFAIIWWMADVFPSWLTSLVVLIAWVLYGVTPFSGAFGPMAGTTVWMLWGVFALAAAASQTGLLKRIAYGVMKICPGTFGGQAAAMIVAGTVLAPVVPSANTKTLLVGSLSANVADNMGFELESKERHGLFNAAWVGAGLTIPLFMSASPVGVAMRNMLPEEVAADVTWTSWFLAALPWGLIMLVGMWFAIKLLFAPKSRQTYSKEFINENIAQLGKMGKDEIITAVLLVFALVCWVFEKKIGISSAMTATIVGTVLFLTGVLKPKQLSTSIPWSILIFACCITNINGIFNTYGINEWIKQLITPLLSGVSNTVLLILLVTVIAGLSRLVLTSQTVVIVTFVTILTPVITALGYNPFPWYMIAYFACQAWWFPYMHITYAPLPGAIPGINKDPRIKVCACYYLVSTIGALVSIPWWGMLGWM